MTCQGKLSPRFAMGGTVRYFPRNLLDLGRGSNGIASTANGNFRFIHPLADDRAGRRRYGFHAARKPEFLGMQFGIGFAKHSSHP